MALIGSPSAFVSEMALHAFVCGECLGRFKAGSRCLASRRKGRLMKRVCSEECRQTFDDNYWQARARGEL